MHETNAVREHYAVPEMTARIEKALHDAGYGDEPIPWQNLAPLDQFHTRGLAATLELAEGLNLGEGSHILDVGSGLGGPARYLAAARGCRVTGIDLTPLYVEIATMLSERTGLADRNHFVAGDALAMPFESESFDSALTQHVAMNIADKNALYREIYRVLKPGGQLAIYDVVTGENSPVIYPAPWAFTESISFLVSPQEMQELLIGAGFHLVSAVNTTEKALAWFAELSSTPPTNALNLGAIIGGSVPQAVANLARNMKENRVRVVQVIVEKASANEVIGTETGDKIH